MAGPNKGYPSTAEAEGFFRSLLEKIAHKIERTGKLPDTMTLPECPSECWWHLNELFQANIRKLSGGRVRVRFEGMTATTRYWRGCFYKAGIECEQKDDDKISQREQCVLMLQRLELQFPDARAALKNIRSDFLANRTVLEWPSAYELLKGVFQRFLQPSANMVATTLSQLGSDLLNDSKALRDGRGRALLGLALGAIRGEPETEERELFKYYGIIENPYTTYAVCHVPFEFKLDGERFDFPRRMFDLGVAVTLPLEIVERMTNVTLIEVDTIKTSENAAPFHRMVEEGEICVYTEGYPNSAVKRLLAHFARRGANAIHYGDTDLDGYRIASEVGRAIPVTLPSLPDNLPRKPLTEEAKVRLSTFIESHRKFPYQSQLRDTLEFGWIEQEKF